MHVGEDGQAEGLADLGEDRQGPVEPDPPGGLAEVRLALSKDDLNTSPIPSAAAISFRAAAISSPWLRPSNWQGPAIRASGRWLAKAVSRTRTTVPGEGEFDMGRL